jgi:hypothetical protein
MSKSKYGDSNLYMTTREFADLVIDALHEQNYFKRYDVAHPQDIAMSFATVGESIGTAMSWAISKEHEAKKKAVMTPTDLRKSALPIDDEIAPSSLYYSEHKANKGYL